MRMENLSRAYTTDDCRVYTNAMKKPNNAADDSHDREIGDRGWCWGLEKVTYNNRL